MMKRKVIISYIFILLLLITLSGLYLVEMNLREWRSDDLRPHYEYTVQINGLSGKDAFGTTKILIPIPATKEGTFAITPSQKEPSFLKSLLQEYVYHTPDKYKKGIYFENTTESFDNKSISGNWTTSIVNTKHGPMLEFKTNESILTDISFSKFVVLEQVNNKDPINENNPILYPIVTEASVIKDDYQIFRLITRLITYESHIEISDNIDGKDIRFNIVLEVYPDVNERVGHIGTYTNKLELISTESGELRCNATIELYL